MGGDAWTFILWPIPAEKSETHWQDGRTRTPELSAVSVTKESRVSTCAQPLAVNGNQVSAAEPVDSSIASSSERRCRERLVCLCAALPFEAPTRQFTQTPEDRAHQLQVS